jgi:hypothetical protein
MKVTSTKQIGMGYKIGTSNGKAEQIEYYAENPNPDQPWPPELGSEFKIEDKQAVKLPEKLAGKPTAP